MDTVIDQEAAPEEAVERSLDCEQLYDALQRLGEDQRQVIILKFMQELDNATVAKVIGRSEAAVKSLQHRGLVALRRTLATQGGGDHE